MNGHLRLSQLRVGIGGFRSDIHRRIGQLRTDVPGTIDGIAFYHHGVQVGNFGVLLVERFRIEPFAQCHGREDLGRCRVANDEYGDATPRHGTDGHEWQPVVVTPLDRVKDQLTSIEIVHFGFVGIQFIAQTLIQSDRRCNLPVPSRLST